MSAIEVSELHRTYRSWNELLVGFVYLLLRITMLRWFEYASRRSAALEAF